MNLKTPQLAGGQEPQEHKKSPVAAISAKGSAFGAKAQRVMRSISVGLFIGAGTILLTSITPIWGDFVVAFVGAIAACSFSSYGLVKHERMHPIVMMLLFVFFGGVLIALARLLNLLPSSAVPVALVALFVGMFVGQRIGAGLMSD